MLHNMGPSRFVKQIKTFICFKDVFTAGDDGVKNKKVSLKEKDSNRKMSRNWSEKSENQTFVQDFERWRNSPYKIVSVVQIRSLFVQQSGALKSIVGSSV